MKAEALAKPTAPPSHRRDEKAEKGEKNEKRESRPLLWVMAGALIIVVGLLSYASASGLLNSQLVAPLTLLLIGVVLTLFGLYLYLTHRGQLPSPFV